MAALGTILLLLSLLGAIAGPSVRSAGAAPIPSLTSLTRTSAAAVQPGSTVTYAYTATGPLQALRMFHRDSMGRNMLWQANDLPASGEFSFVVPDGVLNGSEACAAVFLYYGADQPVQDSCPVAAPDFTVSGSTPRLAAPVLVALGTHTPTVSPGQTFGIDYTVTDDDPISTVQVTLADRFGSHPFTISPRPGLSGTVLRGCSLYVGQWSVHRHLRPGG